MQDPWLPILAPNEPEPTLIPVLQTQKQGRGFTRRQIQPWRAASGPGKSRYRPKVLTGGCYHTLPLLEKAGLEAVARAEAVGLVAGHELLHGLEYHTQLWGDPEGACQGRDTELRQWEGAETE